MNKQLKFIYTIIGVLSIIIYIFNFKDNIKGNINYSKEIKYLLVGFANIVMIYSLYYTNDIVNKYIAPLCVFSNVAMLLYISYSTNEITIIHILSMVGLVYLLLTLAFNYKKFEIKHGAFHIQSNRQWVYLYILFLGLGYIKNKFVTDEEWIISKSPKINIIISCLLLLYPLLFPIEEYFIHRPASLVMVYLIFTHFKSR